MKFSWQSPLKICAAFFLVLPVVAQNMRSAQLPEFSILGMDEFQLAILLPDIKRLARPQLGPRGERGRWVASKTILFGLPFDTTYFTKNGRIARVEKVWTAADSSCARRFSVDGVIEKLRAEYGTGQVSNAPPDNESVRQSAVWVVDEAQMSLYTDVSPAMCSMRIVFQPRLVKDGSEL